jgi:hypothetical protein
MNPEYIRPSQAKSEKATTTPTRRIAPEYVSNMLPYSVRTALVKASKVEHHISRAAAIETVRKAAHLLYPQLFREEALA